MAEVPEHLLRRSKERRKALGLPVDGDDDAAEGDAAGGADAGEAPARQRAPVAEVAPAAAASDAISGGRRDRGRRQDPGAPARAVAEAQGRPPAVASRRPAAVAARNRDRGGRAPDAGHDRPGRSHPAAAHGRQVGVDPADARRGRRQGARLAAPARHRVRVDAHHPGAAPRSSRRSCARRCSGSPTSTRRRTRRRHRGTSWVSRSCSRCSTRWSRA